MKKENLSIDGMMTVLNKKSGLLGISTTTGDIRDLKGLIEKGDKKAELAIDMFAYRVKKYIGSYMAVLGKVDAIILTGGIAYSSLITENIRKRVEFISDVCVMPGENELEALSKGILRVLNKEEEASVYRESILAKS